jgi:hypothetical protein
MDGEFAGASLHVALCNMLYAFGFMHCHPDPDLRITCYKTYSIHGQSFTNNVRCA